MDKFSSKSSSCLSKPPFYNRELSEPEARQSPWAKVTAFDRSRLFKTKSCKSKRMAPVAPLDSCALHVFVARENRVRWSFYFSRRARYPQQFSLRTDIPYIGTALRRDAKICFLLFYNSEGVLQHLSMLLSISTSEIVVYCQRFGTLPLSSRPLPISGQMPGTTPPLRSVVSEVNADIHSM